MAEQKDLDFTYTTIDEIFRLSIGETGDYSGAKYDGDFSMTLEEAQKAKHDQPRLRLRSQPFPSGILLRAKPPD